MSTNKAFVDGAIFNDAEIGKRVATYEDVQNVRFGGDYTVGDVAMGEYDFREESGDRDQSALTAREDVARIQVSAARAFGNPRATKNMTESQRVHSMWYRYAETMSLMDASTAKLLNELASVGWQAARETADRLSGEKRQGQLDKGGFSDRFLVVAQTEGEARIVRAWIDLAMKHVTDGLTPNDARPLRYKLDNLPPVAEVGELLRATRPGAAKEAVIGVVVAPGAERAAVDFMASDKREFFVGASQELWKQLKSRKDVKAVSEPAKKGAKDIQINNNVAWKADRLAVFLSNDENENAVVLNAAAIAFQRGTLAVAFDAAGNEVSQFTLGEDADKIHPSRKVEEHLSEINRFMPIQASSPEGRLFLSLLPKMGRVEVDALANSRKTVGEILAIARNEDGRETLYGEFKLPSGAIEGMKNSYTIGSAGKAWDRIKLDCSNNGVAIVGPENFPGNLKGDLNAPAVLYVQAKDPHTLGNAKAHVLMAGDDGVPNYLARRGHAMAQLVDAEGVAIAQIENAGQPGFAGKSPVLWLASGHGHADVQTPVLQWSAERSARGPVSTWTIESKKLDKKDLYELFETSHDGAKKSAQKLFVERSEKAGLDAVQTLKTKASQAEAERAKAPVLAARKALVEAGGFVVSAQPPVDKNLAYRHQTKMVVGYRTAATRESRREIARLAAKASDAVCVTYTKGDTTSSAMIGAAIEAGKGMIAVSVPDERQFTPAVERHVALYTKPGRQIADLFHNLPAGTAKVKLTGQYADEQVCGKTGKELAGAALRIAQRVGVKPAAKQEAKKSADRELA